MRNARSARKELEYGIDFTNKEYNRLTGLDIDKAKIHLKSWKHFQNKGMPSNGYYNGYGYIYFGITLNPNSNIRLNNSRLRFMGGHEQTHYAEDAIKSNFNSPALYVRTGKDWRSFVPSVKHPVAKKYEAKFLKGNLHGRNPEETWANYMGEKARGASKISYYLDNYLMEGVNPLTTRNFIRDYKQYLTKTYNH